MNRCDVSVVIPTYNRENFLARAIRSVLKQTMQCAEIIVIDDGSTDSTAALVDELQSRSFAQINYFYQENKGPAAARNLGLRKAEGHYVAFLDSDDHWQKKKLQVQYEQMQSKPHYVISHTKEKWLRRGVHLNQKTIHIPRHGDIFPHCLQLCAVGMSTTMVRRELFDEVGFFDETLSCCEDYDMWLRVSALYEFLLIDAPLTIKEGGRDDQLSVRFRQGMDRFRIKSLEKLVASSRISPPKINMARSMLVQKAQIYGNGCRKHHKLAEAAYYFALVRKYNSG